MKFLNHNLFTGDITVNGTTTLSTATGVTRATGDNSTHLATTAFVKAQGYATTAALSGYVPTSRTLTINGTTFDLSANRSWTISGSDGYISNIQLVDSTLSFTGVGSAFSGIIDLSTLTPTVRTVYETVKNVSGATILKGTPLAVVAGQTSGNVSDVVPANAADPTKMPAIFIANQNIADQAEGEAVLFGNLTGVNTSAYTSGTTVYVAAGGGWTATKPVWPNLIQNLGVITKQHATNGAGIVTGVGRANSLPNLTAGKIWVGSATYPIESTTVHVDEANGRVGIGTTSPAQKLHVVGNTTITGVTYTDIVQTYSGASIDFRHQDASVVMRVDTANARVGIGTTSPSDKLHVNDTSRFVNNTTNSLGGALYTGTKPSSWLFPLETGSTMRQTVIGQATTAGTALPQLNNYGGVGIIGVGGLNTGGRTNIGVFGYQYFSQNMSSNTGNSGYGGYFLAKGIGSCTDFKGEYIGVYGEGNIGTDAVVSTYGSISGGKFVAVGTTNQTTYGVYAQATGGTTNYSVYAPNGNAYFADRVGIGTTTPSDKLVVFSTASRVATFFTSATAQTVYFGSSSQSEYSDLIIQANNGQAEIFRSGTGYSGYGGTSALNIWNSNGPISFHPNNIANSMTIASSGNVGIGTTSPAYKLDVIGTFRSNALWTDSSANAYWGNGSTLTTYGVLTWDTGIAKVFATSGNRLDLGANGSVAATINTSGSVGIGTTNPSEKIHVVGNVRIDGGSTAAILQTNNATAAEAGTTYRTFTTADHYAVFVDYVVYDAGRGNMRTGTFRAVWTTGDVVYTDVSTVDLGGTDNVTLTAAISGANVNLIVTGPADYTLKYSLKVIK